MVIEAGALGAGASTRSGPMVTGGPQGERVAKYRLDADYVRYGRIILAHVPQHTKRLKHSAKLLSEHAGSTVSILGRTSATRAAC